MFDTSKIYEANLATILRNTMQLKQSNLLQFKKTNLIQIRQFKVKPQTPYDRELIYDNSGGDLMKEGTEQEDLDRNNKEIFD